MPINSCSQNVFICSGKRLNELEKLSKSLDLSVQEVFEEALKEGITSLFETDQSNLSAEEARHPSIAQ